MRLLRTKKLETLEGRDIVYPLQKNLSVTVNELFLVAELIDF